MAETNEQKIVRLLKEKTLAGDIDWTTGEFAWSAKVVLPPVGSIVETHTFKVRRNDPWYSSDMWRSDKRNTETLLYYTNIHHQLTELASNSWTIDYAGIWSNGTTMWVVGSVDNKLYAYILTGGTIGDRDSDNDIILDSANTDPVGMWSDDTTIWVSDSGTPKKLYAYTLSGGSRDAAKDIILDSANADPTGIWSDNTTMWVADSVDNKLYAYILTAGNTFGDRIAAKDITLHTEIDAALSNTDPIGIWSDTTTMWVADNADDKLYAYILTEGPTFGNRITGKDITLHSNNTDPLGIWSDNTTMWVAVSGDNKLYAYILTAGGSFGNRIAIKDIDPLIDPHNIRSLVEVLMDKYPHLPPLDKSETIDNALAILGE